MSDNKKGHISPITEGACPHCGANLNFSEKDRSKGEKISCPKCKKEFRIEEAKVLEKKKKGKGCLIAIIIFVGLALIGVLVPGSIDEEEGDLEKTEQQEVVEQREEEKQEETEVSEEEVPEEKEPEVYQPTVGERNALRSANNYLSVMAFSYTGLIKQLEFEGYSRDEAIYAVDNCGADWNEQAAKSAKNYIDTMAFSRSGLIKQLEFEGYTREQAEYGADAVGY
jgi:nitrite reductase/ring-hydroxylating ferredoxin subunit